ncbi:hypothetical protein [Streptomyces niveus]|uniref:hypothetical protein n=1 Tax=Streptomyces niveus TaxID=193462 RepID=UPI0035D80C81
MLAGVVWAITLLSLTWLAFLFGMATLWGLAAGVPLGGILLRYALIVATAGASLTALAFAPGVRQLAAESRLLLLGVIACPLPTVLAITTWFRTG